MEFIILDKDPEESARLLPELVLRCNCDHGVRILSVIGQRTGVDWYEQISPLNTRKTKPDPYMINKAAFLDFIEYLAECLYEYKSRFGEDFPRGSVYTEAPLFSITCRIPAGRTEYQFTAEKLLQEHSDRMTAHEIKRLKDLL